MSGTLKENIIKNLISLPLIVVFTFAWYLVGFPFNWLSLLVIAFAAVAIGNFIYYGIWRNE